jgi:hypothetical protein
LPLTRNPASSSSEQVGQGARIGDATIHQLARLAQAGSIHGVLLRMHVEANLGGRQILTQAVVKFAGDAPAFIILHAQQFCRKPAKSGGSLLHQRLQRVMGSAKGIFCHSSFLQMVANFVLAPPREQCGTNRA